MGRVVRAVWRGQAATEYLVCVAALAAALLLPVVDGASIATLLARRISQAIHGFYLLIAFA